MLMAKMASIFPLSVVMNMLNAYIPTRPLLLL